MRRLLISLLAFALIGGTAVGLSLVSPERMPASATVELPRTTRMTCLHSGRALVYAPGEVTATSPQSGEHLFSTSEPGAFDDVTGPFVLTADSLAVAGVHGAGPPPVYAPCAPATTSGMLLVTDPVDTELLIANTDANEAVVDLTLLGPDGEVPAVGARGIAVAPGVTRRIALSVLAPEGPVGVSYLTSEGRVAIAAVNLEGRDPRHVGPARTAGEHVIAGIPAEVASTQLVVANPFEERAEVTVTALGSTSEYELAPTADLTVEPMSSVAVDLADSLGGEAAAIRVTSTHDVGAAVVVAGEAGSPVTLTGSDPATEVAATTLGGVLHVTNPGTEAVTLRTTATGGEVTLEPGTTQALALDADGDGGWPVQVTADAPVVAAAVSAGEQGLVVIPLGRVADEPRSVASAELNAHLR